MSSFYWLREGLGICSLFFLLLLGTSSLEVLTCPSPPNVTLFVLDSNSDPIGVGVRELSFNVSRTSKPSFLLVCNHSSPIHWILDEDLTLGEVSQPSASSTFRTFLNFSDSSSYSYSAVYYVSLRHPSKDHVFICQPFQAELGSGNNGSVSDVGCVSRSVVLAEIQYTLQASGIKKLRVEVLSEEEVSQVVPPLKEFDLKEKHRLESPDPTDANQTCPFTLTLVVDNGDDLYTEWNSGNITGISDVIIMHTAQMIENVNRFHPQMASVCITFGELKDISNKNSRLGAQSHKFSPLAFTYSLGNERRVLKTFFDLTESSNFYYSWEPVNLEDMIYGTTQPKNIYKGQNFTVTCLPYVSFYSRGTQISWNFPFPSQFVDGRSGLVPELDFLAEEGFAEFGGTYEVKARLFFSREFLIENDFDTVELSCVSPLWNSNYWVNYTFSVPLQDSELPKIIYENDPSSMAGNLTLSRAPILYELDGTEENFTISCEASGTPLPILEFIPFKNNLDILQLEPETTENGTTLLGLLFPIISSEIEGDYTCLATSVVGEDRKVFRLSIKTSFISRFLLIILISGGVVIFLFLLVSTGLLIRLRKEKVAFILATQEAIKKFEEGFSATPDLGFKSNSEYKDYEIPINRWGLGSTMLGSGAFGVVQKGVIYYGENRQDVVAVKTVSSPKDVTEFENSLMELTIMSYIGRHEHIVSLVGACTDNMSKRSILIGVEYCANGDLLNYLQKRRALFRSFVGAEDGVLSLDSVTGKGSYANFANSGNFTSHDLYKWSFQIANGMDFLTSKKILHADLAARNVLLTNDNICKISDFGLSRQLLMSDNYTKTTNSPLPWRWMAIESLKYRQFSSASDIWSYGVLLFEIFSLGEVPWPGLGWTNEFMEEMNRGRRLSRPKFATNNIYNKIMLECWRLEPEQRITFAQARDFFETAISTLTSPEGQDDDMLNSLC